MQEAQGIPAGKLYLVIGQDTAGALAGVYRTATDLVREEELGYTAETVSQESAGGVQVGFSDLQFTGSVTQYDLGSRFVRYVLTFLSLMGSGACKLRVSGELRRGDGKTETLNLAASQAVGVFGGKGEALMEQNIKIIARSLVRRISGRKVLNKGAYRCAIWSLVLGLFSLVPYLGFVLSPIGIICGLVAISVISRRSLPKRKALAIIGLVLSALAFFLNIYYTAALN